MAALHPFPCCSCLFRMVYCRQTETMESISLVWPTWNRQILSGKSSSYRSRFNILQVIIVYRVLTLEIFYIPFPEQLCCMMNYILGTGYIWLLLFFSCALQITKLPISLQSRIVGCCLLVYII